MKTKHLFYTLALAGAFTACTQDEFVAQGNNDALVGRKSLGKITFVGNDSPSTRWAVDNFNTISPEEGDGFSLFLVDVPRTGLDGQHLYPYDNYELVNDVHTNYVFKKNGDGWDSEANLVEGNYLFVAPSQATQDRKPVEITLPTEQNLALGADGKLDGLSAIKEFAKSGYPFYIGHRFLSEEGEGREALPAMVNIFAYPEITVKNTDRNRQETAILKKVIIKQKDVDKPFTINAPLNNIRAAQLLTNELFAMRGTDTKNRVVVGDWAGHMSTYFGAWKSIDQEWKSDASQVEIPNTVDYQVTYLGGFDNKYYLYNNGLYGKTSDLLDSPKSTSQYIIINMPGDGIELGYNESITFNAIIPADRYVMSSALSNELTIYAVLQNDEAYEKVMKSNTTVDMYPGKRYPNQDYTGLEVKGSKGLYFTIDINEDATDGLSTYKKVSAAEVIGGVTTIKSTADLIAAIKAHTSTEVLNITVEGKDVVYNDEVNKAVANTTCQNINIQGHLKVVASQPLAINSRVTIEDAVIESGMVTYNSNTADLKNVFVARGAALDLQNTKSDNNTIINNAGTLTLGTTKVKEVNNYAVLQVSTDISTIVSKISNQYAACGDMAEIISPSINLTPSVTVLAGGKYAIGGDLYYWITVNAKSGAKAAGQLVLSNDAQIAQKVEYIGEKRVVMTGNIINNGIVNADSYNLTVNAGRSLTVGANAEIEGQLVISGASATLSDLQSTPANTYTNAAEVINNGILDDVKVDGKLVMGSGSRINGNITASGSTEGEIDNTAKGVIANTPSGDVTVYATFTGLNLVDANAKAAAVAAFNAYTASYQVKEARLTGAVVIGDADVQFNKTDVTTSTIDKIVFAEGSSLTIGDAQFSSNFNISVSAWNIKWTGNTSTNSRFNLTGTLEKDLYLTTNAANQYTAAEGNVVFTNCATVSGLE